MSGNILEITGLTTRVSGYTILDDLYFSVEENELRVLLGPNGAGKTTLIDMISGRYKPTSGKILFENRDITGMAPHRIFKRGICRKFQVPNMYETLSVFDNVMISLAGHRLVVQSLFHKHTTADQDRVVEILEFIGLVEKAGFPADALSHGERQWLEMGMLIAADPKLLLLDEPTTGMTEADKQKTAELIQRIAERHTVLLVEHDMHVVRRLGNFVTVLHQGGILAEGLLADVVANEEVRQVYLGQGKFSGA
ncbi:MAG: ATP-binding cassette domain-containing protein [Rhodospirillales bacterium]|nr:ATP-binding cassette domain-containing protein [Rhodospirillales bacterium]